MNKKKKIIIFSIAFVFFISLLGTLFFISGNNQPYEDKINMDEMTTF